MLNYIRLCTILKIPVRVIETKPIQWQPISNNLAAKDP